MSDENGVDDDAIEIDPQSDQTTDASGPVTSPDQPGGGDEATDQQINAEVASSPTAQGGGPNPDQPAAPQDVAPGGSTATSQSASFKGVPGGPTAVKDIYATHEAAAAQDNDIDRRNTDAQLAQYTQDNAAVGKAVQGEVDAATVYQQEDKRLQGLIGDEAKRQQDAEQKAQQAWQLERSEKLRDYQQQLTAVQTLAMQSGSPFVGMGKGAYLGLAGAEFAQGFLAARGVKIDVSGQVEKWVNNSIQEHQFQVQTMQNVAADKLHLYDVARQTSIDDTEARARYGGMVVSGLQAQVAANANMYNSKLAQSQAQVVQAQLKTKGDEYQNTLIQQYQSRAENRLRAEQQAAYRQSEMSIQEFRAQQAAKVAAARATAVAPPSQLLSYTDPSNTNKAGGERVAFVVDPKVVGPEGVKTLDAATDAFHQQAYLVKQMRGLLDSADVEGHAPLWWKDATSPEYQAFNAKRLELTSQFERALGGTRGASSPGLLTRFDKILEQPNLTHWGNRAGDIDSFMGDLRNGYVSTMSAGHAHYVGDVSGKALQAHGVGADSDGYAESTAGFDRPDKALAANAFTKAPPPTSTEQALGVLTSRQATDSPVASTEEGAKEARAAAAAGKAPTVEASPAFIDYLKSTGHDDPTTWLAATGYRNEYRSIDTLVRNARSGDALAKHALDRITEDSAYDKNHPERVVTAGHIPGTDIRATPEMVNYARYAVKRADKGGDAFEPSPVTLNTTQQRLVNARLVMGRDSNYDPIGDQPYDPASTPQ